MLILDKHLQKLGFQLDLGGEELLGLPEDGALPQCVDLKSLLHFINFSCNENEK